MNKILKISTDPVSQFTYVKDSEFKFYLHYDKNFKYWYVRGDNLEEFSIIGNLNVRGGKGINDFLLESVVPNGVIDGNVAEVLTKEEKSDESSIFDVYLFKLKNPLYSIRINADERKLYFTQKRNMVFPFFKHLFMKNKIKFCVIAFVLLAYLSK